MPDLLQVYFPDFCKLCPKFMLYLGHILIFSTQMTLILADLHRF
jgi:hypothetical protein